MSKHRLCRTVLCAILCLSGPVLFAAENARPIVRQISAAPVSSSHIEISWKLPKNAGISSLLIFRDTQPLATKAQLANLTPLAEVKGSMNYYIDTVKNYRAYYYAVIAKDAAGALYDVILPSINATVTEARVERPEKTTISDPELAEEKLYADGQKRELPLPYLNMLESQDKKPNKLKPEVMAAGKGEKGIDVVLPAVGEDPQDGIGVCPVKVLSGIEVGQEGEQVCKGALFPVLCLFVVGQARLF